MMHSPTDLEIRISVENTPGDLYRLAYMLHSPSGKAHYTHFEVEAEVEIFGHPRDYQERMLAGLETLGEGQDAEGNLLHSEEIASEVEAIGRELYRDLFPRALQLEYERFRTQVASILIISDEPWIPWELIRPFSEDFDDDFLGCRFELTRWLAGEVAPAEGMAAGRISCFEAGRVPGYQPLPLATAEGVLLGEMAQRHAGVDYRVVTDATYAQVIEGLRSRKAGVLHFAGHGEAEPDAPNESRFLLTDERSLRPRDLLHGGIVAKLRQARPLVFFNSCQVAQQSYSLSRLGGWAPRWVLDCGCGAFVGPQWSIGDAPALLFAKTFYQALEDGETIGRATRRARLVVRAEQPGGAAWLAYAVYAQPNAKLHLGQAELPQTEPRDPIGEPLSEDRNGLAELDDWRRMWLQRYTGPNVALASAWTKLGVIHFILVGLFFLRNRSLPVAGFLDRLQGDVAAFMGIFFGLPVFLLSLYVATKHCDNVELPRTADKLPFWRRVALRLPIAFQSRIQGKGHQQSYENAYQLFFLFLFVVLPMTLQGFLYIQLMKAPVWRQRELELFIYTFKDQLTTYVSPAEAFLNDNFRIGSIDNQRYLIENVTYFPFWEAWGLLIAELGALAMALWLLWKLMTRTQP